jgi:hypothetical protein
VFIDDLMKPDGSIRVVKRWCGMHTDHVHWCFWARELANGVGLGTAVPS